MINAIAICSSACTLGIRFILMKFKEFFDEGNEILTSQLGFGFQRKGSFHYIYI
jgi:hypothetical protein